MTYVVTDNCIGCKHTDCVEVCPVDCFYEGENVLVIHPDECIDCGVCEPECPVDAILPDTEPDMEKWVEFNRKYSEIWPVIITQIEPLPKPTKWMEFPISSKQFFLKNRGKVDKIYNVVITIYKTSRHHLKIAFWTCNLFSA